MTYDNDPEPGVDETTLALHCFQYLIATANAYLELVSRTARVFEEAGPTKNPVAEEVEAALRVLGAALDVLLDSDSWPPTLATWSEVDAARVQAVEDLSDMVEKYGSQIGADPSVVRALKAKLGR